MAEPITLLAGALIALLSTRLERHFSAGDRGRAACNRALRELLTVRYDLITISRLLQLLRTKLSLSDEQMPAFRAMMLGMLGRVKDDGVRARYLSAIDALAEVQP